MLFSDLYRSPRSPLLKLRNSLPHTNPASSPNFDADLVSRDKTKQKEAVKRYLSEKVRNDWEFQWPPASSESNPPADHGEQSSTAGLAQGPTAAGLVAVVDADAGTPLETGHEGQLVAAAGPGESQGQEDVELEGRDAGEEADSESDSESLYSTVSEDAVHFCNRAEWLSDLSDEDLPPPGTSPFRFDSPETVGAVVRASVLAGKARRRRQLRDEAAWNDGLACFLARRDAWTGARTARVKPKRAAPHASPSPRRLFWRSHTRTESSSSVGTLTPVVPLTMVKSAPAAPPPSLRPFSPATTRRSHHSRHSHHFHPADSDALSPSPSEPDSIPLSKPTSLSAYPVETLLPVPPPLLPPQNPMRASISPSIYPSLYDKVIVNGLQPSCPINLADIMRTCVVGWKRDGEWPPPGVDMRPCPPRRPAGPKKAAARARRPSLVGFLERLGADGLGREHHAAAGEATAVKGIRRSLQKVLGLGTGGYGAGTGADTAGAQHASKSTNAAAEAATAIA